MAIATLILAVLLGAVGITVLRGTGLYQQSLAGNQLEAQATRVVERIVAELMDADRSTMTLNPPAPFGASSIEYERGQGLVAGVLAVTPRRRIQAQMAATELDDGLDNDNDGLADEWVVQILPDTVGAPAQVVGWGNYVREYLEGELPNGADDNGNGLVDERGLCLTYDVASTSVTVRLTLERPDAQGRLIVRTVQAVVQIRNE